MSRKSEVDIYNPLLGRGIADKPKTVRPLFLPVFLSMQQLEAPLQAPASHSGKHYGRPPCCLSHRNKNSAFLLQGLSTLKTLFSLHPPGIK